MKRMKAAYLKCEIHARARVTATEQLEQHDIMFFDDVAKRAGIHTFDPQSLWWDYIKEDLEQRFGALTPVNERIKLRGAREDIQNDPARFLCGPHRLAIGFCTNKYMGGVLAVQRLQRQNNVADGMKQSVHVKATLLQSEQLLPDHAHALLPPPPSTAMQ